MNRVRSNAVSPSGRAWRDFAWLLLSLWPLAFGTTTYAAVGASTPFISLEAEAGFCGGGATVYYLTNSSTSPYSSPELEASGHAFVALTAPGQFVQWTNNTGANITAVNLRSCIPDAPAGGGLTNTIDFYVNGSFRQAFPVNSMQNYCYEGTNYNGQADKNPADGDPRDFWDDTHALLTGAPVAPGSTFRFQMDASNTAAFYYVDVVDVENPPSPASQPVNSLSIVNYGAIPNNPNFDNTSAINNCFKAAATQGKIAWIPAGTWYISAINGCLNASGITIAGAGPWYSTIYRLTPTNNNIGVGNIITTVSCTLSNVFLDCNSWSRDGANNNGAVDFSGTNWVVNNVWMQHTTSSFWCAGVNGIAENCRTLSTWADGGNFNNVQSDNGVGMNLVYSNNFVRSTGDDAMAINSVNFNVYGLTTNYYTTMSHISYVNNTAVAPWGGKCMGIYGGTNVLVANNLLTDCPRYLGLGVMKFGVNGSDLFSAVVTGNLLLRCGGNGYNQQQQGLMVGNGGDGQSVGSIENAYIASNTIIDALYDGIGFSTSTNIVLEYNSVIAPGLNGIVPGAPDLGSGVAGFAVLNFNTVTQLNTGQVPYLNSAGNYFVGGIGNIGFTVPGPVVSPWLSQDLGPVTVPGGASFNKGVFTLVGSGADIGGATDACHYVYQPVAGNCSISAEVASMEILNASAKTGVMIRNSLDPADQEVSVLLTPANGVVFEWRGTYGGGTSNLTVTNLAFPYWVQLARNGNTFTASISPDGHSWMDIGAPQSIAMATNVLVGMPITSHLNGALSSSMIDNVSVNTTAQEYLAVRWEGNLVVNLQSSDLSPASSVWTNRTSDANSVGNFATLQGTGLNVTNATWNSQTVKALSVNDLLENAVQSALNTPTEIISNNSVSAEAWIYATAVNQQNSCAIGYGIQGGPSFPEEDREFNYSAPCCGGGVSGDFGTYDTPWATTPAPGSWHYLAWTYDGSTVRLYLDGELNAANSPSSPLQTPSTIMGVGAGIANSGPDLGADAFQGFIAAARVESGVLTSADIATNYALGPLASAGALTPSGLIAVPGDGEVALTWLAPGNASTYTVAMAADSGGPYVAVATNLTNLSYTATGLSNGMTYFFVVSAVNAAGPSPNSAPVSALPVSVSPPQLSFGISSNQLRLAWPHDHTSWTLQVQSNAFGQNLGTQWTSLPASQATNQITFPINPAAGSVFFRLVYP